MTAVKNSVIALLVALGCSQSVALAAKAPTQQTEHAVVVQVASAKQKTMPIFINALGSLSAVKQVTISSQTAGRVADIYFKNGQQVGKGMPILKLDDSAAQANYKAAVTTLDLSRRKYQRAKLLPQGAIAQQEIDQLKATMENNDSTVKKDLSILNQQTVTAPFSGVLGAFHVQVGDYVSAGDPIVQLVNRDMLRDNFNVSQDRIPFLKQGQLVQITVDAYPKQTFYGTVSFISPMVSDTTRAVQVQAMVANKKNLLSPGMFCHVAQQVGEKKGAIVIPQVAVNADIKGYYTYLVKGHKAIKQYVTPGSSQKGLVQIAKGLKAGDQVVVAGQQKLQDGSDIRISNHDSGD